MQGIFVNSPGGLGIMLDAFYLTGWGAYGMTLFLLIPFAVVFWWVIHRKSVVDPNPSGADKQKYVRLEWMWIGFVAAVFVGVNVGSIGYMPTVVSAKAIESGVELTEVKVEAESWSFDISEQKIVVGKPVQFSGRSNDTMHGFAVYHPDGRVLFTMMLMPGMEDPTTLVHTFTEPGTYTVRCLEYCGLSHHEMRDEIEVVGR